MELPKSVYEAVASAEAKNPGDPPAAIEAAKKLIRSLPEFPDLAAEFFHRTVQELVYAQRHRIAGDIKRAAGGYGQPSKVAADSPAIRGVYESVYQYRMGGTVLGDIMGENLADIAEGEEEKARGHQFNARLARYCIDQGVKDGQSVREVIPEKKLRMAFDRIQKETQGKAA